MVKDFVSGMNYVGKGLCAFFNDKKTWRFAIIPFLIMLIFYSVAIYGIFRLSHVAAEYLAEMSRRLPDWLSWISFLCNGFFIIFSILFTLLFLSLTVSAIYEFFGGFFFDSLTEYYEKKNFNVIPGKKSFSENLKYAWNSFCWGIYTMIAACFLFLLSLILPILGPLILIIVMGYFIGITYMISSAGNNNVSVTRLRSICSKRPVLVMGFGISVYILLSIPFVSILFLPGVVLGGSELFNTELKKLDL